MSHLKSLTLTVAPHQIERNPKLLRRQRLIERLEEQQKLAADPTFTVLVRRWIKDLDGVKQPLTVRSGSSRGGKPMGTVAWFWC